MPTLLLAVGKLRPAYRALADEYLQRIQRYERFLEHELKAGPAARKPAERVADEARRLKDALPERAAMIALDRSGRTWTSEGLAQQVERWHSDAVQLAIVIGGAFGLSTGLLQSAAFRWSLGPLTLPHELVRVVVLEQWYRAWTIARGERYHK